MKRKQIVEDLPSDISADEWGEIQKYGQILHEENERKAKEAHKAKVKQVRDVLDQQIKHREQL